jgi:hypothetical protein
LSRHSVHFISYPFFSFFDHHHFFPSSILNVPGLVTLLFHSSP